MLVPTGYVHWAVIHPLGTLVPLCEWTGMHLLLGEALRLQSVYNLCILYPNRNPLLGTS